MLNNAAEKTSSLLILVGAPLTTVFLVTKTVTDPVNATKLAVAGGLGFGLLALTVFFNFKAVIKENKLFLILALGFVLSSLNAVINSTSPISQNVYGSFGRNTGFVTYLVLLFVAIGALTLRDSLSFKRIILGLQIAGLINVLYCAWVLMFGDFLSWNNPYGNILGLFGNPNFIGAFLGIFIATIAALILGPGVSVKLRVLGTLVALISFYEVIQTRAIQGIVVTAGGIALVLFFWIRAKWSSRILLASYSTLIFGLGILSILGALQKGPFTFIYKRSVSLRGAYWDAGLKMGIDNPVHGVGMDSYGDWYRRMRSEQAATVLPGPRTITNAAHNVPIDFFAFGGFPLLLTYLALLSVALFSAIKYIRRSKKYDPIFVAMLTAWTCYHVQSVISINQVGLALWGWILTGALISYEKATNDTSSELVPSIKKIIKNQKKQVTSIVSPQLIAGLGVILGLLISTPPFSADMKWRSALDSKDVNKVMAVLKPTYLTPGDSQRYAQAVQLLANSNLLEQAHQIALEGVEFNPNYFDAWRLLYFLPNSTKEEKSNALRMMKKLDPLNPNVLTN
jgi:O-antigen ligase